MKACGTAIARQGAMYALSALGVGVALAVTQAVPALREEGQSILFIAVVMVSSWFGGLGPGLLAMALSIPIIDFYVAPSQIFNEADLARLVVFMLVATLISGINAARQRLEAKIRLRADELAGLDRRKDEFLAMLAHELRGPLASIRNASLLLRQPETHPTEADRARQIIDRQVHHFSRLIDDLLDISRFAVGKIRLCRTPIELKRIVAHAVELSSPLIEARSHELTVRLPDQPVWLDVDATRMAQVLANLLDNAAKYTEPEGHIVFSAESNGGELLLKVQDDGIGMTAENLALAFDLFTQAENTLDFARGGLGLGLNLVRRLVVLHGGTIEVQSAGLGLGTEFRLRLPVLAEGPTEPCRTPEADAEVAPLAIRPRNVLIVDDQVDAANNLATLLRYWGHLPRVAYDGRETLDLLKDDQFRPDLILIDIGLPDIDGFEVARQCRDCSSLDSARIIAMTGYAREEDSRFDNGDFDDHLLKPIDFLALQHLLNLDGTPHNEPRPQRVEVLIPVGTA
ncbi:hypothetical protein BH23PLA1_BH23PLA1_23130 [soil metagenome]